METKLISKMDEVLELLEEIETEHKGILIDDAINLKEKIKISLYNDYLNKIQEIIDNDDEYETDDIIELIEKLIEEYSEVLNDEIDDLSNLLSEIDEDEIGKQELIDELKEIVNQTL